MKILTYVLMGLGALLIIFNLGQLDFDNLFEGDSAIAAIGVLAGLCTVLLLVILKVSKEIEKRSKK